MEIVRVERDQHEPDYGILCQRLGLGAGSATPFGATHCVIEPGGASTLHEHFEREVFWLTQGCGQMTIGDKTQAVSAGDAVLLPPNIPHTLANTSDTEELHFLSLYWDPAIAAPMRPTACLVSSAPHTPNGPLHLGPVSGPYVAADVHARYLRMRDVDARYMSGSDANQSYVATKAAASGTTPEAVTEKYGTRNEATLRALGCDLALFLRPVKDEAYIADVQDFFAELVEAEALELRESEHLHCPTCDRYIHEARVAGGCPRCGAGTCGNGCENCAFVNDCIDLTNPRCTTCDAIPERRTSSRYYLDLAAHTETIEAWFETVDTSPRLRALVAGELARGLPAICVSHCDSWGIPVPDVEGQVIYEWLEMAAGYRHAAARIFEEGPVPFLDSDTGIAQLFGFDNAFFYTMFIPAALLAHDPEVRLPTAFMTNEFFRLEGSKFSTSRDHAVWADDMLEKVPADLLRFHLARERPEFEETNFSLSDLARTAAEELGSHWQGWAQDLCARLADAFDGEVPDSLEETAGIRRLQERAQIRLQAIAEAYEAREFSLRRVARELVALVAEGREFAAATRFLEGGHADACLLAEAGVLRAVAYAAAPLMPETSRRLREALGETGDTWPERVTALAAGQRLAPLEDLGFHAAAEALIS